MLPTSCVSGDVGMAGSIFLLPFVNCEFLSTMPITGGGELLLCSTLPFPFLPPHQREDAHRSIHFFYPLPLSVQIWVPYALDAGCLQLNDAGGGERWCGEGAWERVLGRSVRVDQSRQRNALTGNHSDKRSHVNSSLLPSGYMNKQL
jgi:hypothetical protein